MSGPDEPEDDLEDGADPEAAGAVQMPIDGVLDLHTFHPSEVGDLLDDYLAACRERGILEVRIIHGKGTGALRRTVHAHLARRDDVLEFHTADATQGSWGATLVRLRS